MIKKLLFCFILCLHLNSYAQYKGLAQQQYVIEDGDEYFFIKNYHAALPIYLKLLESLPNNVELQYKIALCYLNTNINRLEALKYLEYVVKHDKSDPEAWLQLGNVYLLSYKLDQAVHSFEQYKLADPKKTELANKKIDYCNNAKLLMKKPVNVSFHNLGKEINSEFPDYYPWISKDESFLAFTTRRKGNIGGLLEGDGYYSSDIYTSEAINDKWNKAKNVGGLINTNLDEQVVGLKADGSEMLVYLDHEVEYGNLYSSQKKGKLFQKLTPLSEQVNKDIEHSGSVSLDGNTLFFVRKEKEKDNTDIYMCRKLPSGQWAEPQKLSNKINSPYNEDFPYLAIDGKTLYFSSEGHNSMGGYDLFKSEWNNETNSWSDAINLGYPINTTDDDRSICISADNRVAYISAVRPNGMGDLDIYRIKFLNVDQKHIIYKGAIAFKDSLNKPKEISANIIATEKKTQDEYSFTPNSETGNFIMALPEGSYNISVTSDGYKSLTENINVSDIGANSSEKKKEYVLERN